MKTTLFILTLFLYSCSAQKVNLSFSTQTPYCGGAKPSPEMAAGRKEPCSKLKVALVKEGGTKIYKWLTLDADGMWIGDLTPGNYLIFQEDKFLTTEELIKKHNLIDSELYRFNGITCLEKWKKEADFQFSFDENWSSVSEFIFKAKCQIGLKPCLEYIGPKVQ
jgi:hypothetical protein